MRLGLCICLFPLKRQYKHVHEHDGLPLIEALAPIRNWRARRRYKLIHCPCGAFFSEDAVRDLGLFSESQWKRSGFPRFKDRSQPYYIDPKTARAKLYWGRQLPDGTWVSLTHKRYGPPPRGRIWRAFYDHAKKRYEMGLWSVDLFTVEDIDTSYVDLTTEQCLKILDSMHPKEQ
jgi:hypothetical protein